MNIEYPEIFNIDIKEDEEIFASFRFSGDYQKLAFISLVHQENPEFNDKI